MKTSATMKLNWTFVMAAIGLMSGETCLLSADHSREDAGQRAPESEGWKLVWADEFEKDLIDSIPFQRLHYIHQLGIAYLVYPGATHT